MCGPSTNRSLWRGTQEQQFAKFLEMVQDAQITIPILDVVLQVPMNAKIFKELLTKKRNINEPEVVTLTNTLTLTNTKVDLSFSGS
jgi:hypothetical protein